MHSALSNCVRRLLRLWSTGYNLLKQRIAAGTARAKIWGVSVPSHKFKVGDVVTLKPAIGRNVPGGTYQVTKRLPENQGEFEYCIKNLDEPYARVVREGELSSFPTSYPLM